MNSTHSTLTKSSLAKSALLITSISFLNKILGLLRESALAAYFGATYESYAYKLAVGIPGILLAVISTSIATAFIPVYTECVRKKSEYQVNRFVNNIFNIIAIFSITLTVFGIFLAPFIVKAIANGLSDKAYLLTVSLTQIAMAGLVFNALYNLGSGYLQANNMFFTPIFAWTVYDLAVFGGMVLLHNKGIEAVTVMTAIATASMFFIQIPSFMRLSYKFELAIDFKAEEIRKMAKLIMPVLISSLFNQLYIFIGRAMAAGLDEGSVSAIDYANRVNTLVYNIFILSIITVVFPDLSCKADDKESFKRTIVKAVRVICLLAFPGMVALFVLRVPIVSLLFERGAFDANDTRMTAVALGCYSASIIGIGLREFLNRVFFARQDTKTPVANGIFVIVINIVLSLIFVKYWGIGGLAAAVSLSALISGVLMLISLERKIGQIGIKKLLWSSAKILAAAVMMGIVMYICNTVLNGLVIHEKSFLSNVINLVFCFCTGAVTYIGILYLMKIEELNIIIKIIQGIKAKLVQKFNRTIYEKPF